MSDTIVGNPELEQSEDLPAPISLIDTGEKIRRTLPVLREMVGEGLVAMTDVETLHHTSSEGKY